MSAERRLESLDLRTIWRALLRRKRTVLATTGAFLLLGVCVNLFLPPLYRASIRLEIRRPLEHSRLTGETFGPSDFQSENLTMLTAADQITNRRLLTQVASDFDTHGWIQAIPTVAWRPPAGDRLAKFLRLPTAGAATAASTPEPVSPAERDAQVDWLQTIVTVQPIQDTRLVDVKVVHNDPEAARVIAERLARLFVEAQWLRSVRADTSGLLYLDDELAQMRARMQLRGESIDNQGASRLASIDARMRQATQNITDLSAEMIRARDDRAALEARIARLSQNAALDRGSDASPSLLAAIRDLQVNDQQLAAARQIYGDKHPKLISLEAQNAALREAYQNERKQALAGLHTERAVLDAREQALNGQLAKSENDLASAQEDAQRFSSVSTDLKTGQDLYGLLAAKVQEGRIEGLMRTPPVEIVDAATLDPHPVQPRKVLNLVVSLLTGLFVGAGLALLLESNRRTIREPREVEDKLELPLVGVIPKQS